MKDIFKIATTLCLMVITLSVVTIAFFTARLEQHPQVQSSPSPLEKSLVSESDSTVIPMALREKLDEEMSYAPDSKLIINNSLRLALRVPTEYKVINSNSSVKITTPVSQENSRIELHFISDTNNHFSVGGVELPPGTFFDIPVSYRGNSELLTFESYSMGGGEASNFNNKECFLGHSSTTHVGSVNGVVIQVEETSANDNCNSSGKLLRLTPNPNDKEKVRTIIQNLYFF